MRLPTLLLALLLALPAAAHAVPQQLTQQGRLFDAEGSAVSGSRLLTFTLYDEADGGGAVWQETLSAELVNGFYAVVLGADTSNPLDALVLEQYPLFLELTVDAGTPLSPRQPLHSSPYAVMAGTAESLYGGTVDATDVAINGTPVIDGSGAWVGPTPDIGWSDLSGVPADLADGDADSLLSLTCALGQLLRFEGPTGAWVCSDDIDTDTQLSEAEVEDYVTNGPLDLAAGTTLAGAAISTGPDADTLAATTCADGELLVYSISAGGWACGADTDSTLSADEVRDIVEDAPLDLPLGTTLGGETIASLTDAAAAASPTVVALAPWGPSDQPCVAWSDDRITCGRDYMADLEIPIETSDIVGLGATSSVKTLAILRSDGALSFYQTEWADPDASVYWQSVFSGTYTAISVGSHGSTNTLCALDTAGGVTCADDYASWQPFTSGVTAFGMSQLDIRVCATLAGGAVDCRQWSRHVGESSITSPPGSWIRAVPARGTNIGCGVRTTGALECWGDASDWSLPSGTFSDIHVGTSNDGWYMARGTDGSVWRNERAVSRSARRLFRATGDAFTQLSYYSACAVRASDSRLFCE